MSEETYVLEFSNDSFAFGNLSVFNNLSCPFENKVNYADLIPLILEKNCYRHALVFTLFLFVANTVVLWFGILGNLLVLQVAIFRLKVETASCIFIINLAVSDLLVLLSCIPATLVANMFTAWIFSETTCKIVAYTQRLSVFCSVYSLVAISFDRCRAMQSTLGTASNITMSQARIYVLIIWLFGFAITLPWVFFKERSFSDDPNGDNAKLAFCQEIWKTSTHEAVYFLLVQVAARFAVPFALITICSIFVWKSLPTSVPAPLLLIPTCIDFRDTQKRRKLRVVKVFTALNLAFILFWLPLYVITARLNFLQQKTTDETTLEHQLISYLIPIAQLLGSCNNCLNPVFYCFLSKKFREPLIQLRECCFCRRGSKTVLSRPKKPPTTKVLKTVECMETVV